MSLPAVPCSVLLPQGARCELAGLGSAEAWRHVVAAATEAEALGYDSVWTVERSHTFPRREPEPVFDCWVTLAALAGHTTSVGLGCLSLCAPWRDPVEIAQRAASIDILSGGRMSIALDNPSRAAGPAPASGLLDGGAGAGAGATETAKALRRLWGGTRATPAECGPVKVNGPEGSPLPVGPVPLHVWDGGGSGARAGAGVFYGLAPEELGAAVARQGEWCAESGIARDALEHTVVVECRMFDDVEERDRWLATPHVVIFWSEHPDLYMRHNLVGSVDAVREQMRAYLAAGATRFLVWFRDYPGLTDMRRLMNEVVPSLGEDW